MTKIICALLSMLLLGSVVKAQSENPVSWSFHAEKTGDKVYTVHLTATIQPGWHIYAQRQPKDAIAQPTVIKAARNPLIQTGTAWKEQGKKETQQLKELGITQYYYAGKVDFTQTVKLKYSFPKGEGREGAVAIKTNLTGTITYMSCTDKMCLPVKTISFSIGIL